MWDVQNAKKVSAIIKRIFIRWDGLETGNWPTVMIKKHVQIPMDI